MRTVFISYSRDDLTQVESVEAQLKSSGDIQVWRDQERLYGGQKWPKILGETIAQQDLFLLFWSRQAAASHFVEFEWTTALALKKTIIPCQLDDTPLPSALAAVQSLSVHDFPRLLTALRATACSANISEQQVLIDQLERITATNPEQVIKQSRNLFDQKNWTVGGNVIQGENITIHIADQGAGGGQRLIEKWQLWVGVVVGILTALTLALELPEKIFGKRDSDKNTTVSREEKLQRIAGAIRNEQNEPLPNVQVSLPQFQKTTVTDHLGQFQFEVKAREQETVALLAQKQGYLPYETDVTLGNIALGFTLRSKKP